MTDLHAITIRTKQGSEWTNDLGQTFPAVPLYSAACECGWKGGAWYSTEERAAAIHERHVAQVTATVGQDHGGGATNWGALGGGGDCHPPGLTFDPTSRRVTAGRALP